MGAMQDLEAQLNAVAPILGLSADKSLPKEQWHVDFKPEATPEQIAAPQNVINTFSWDASERAAQDRVDAIKADPDRSDLITRLTKHNPAQIRAWVQGATAAQLKDVIAAMLVYMAGIANPYRNLAGPDRGPSQRNVEAPAPTKKVTK